MYRLSILAILAAFPANADEVEVMRWYSPSYSETVWFEFEHMDVKPAQTIGDMMSPGNGCHVLNCVALEADGSVMASTQIDPTSGVGAFRYLGGRIDEIEQVNCRLQEI